LKTKRKANLIRKVRRMEIGIITIYLSLKLFMGDGVPSFTDKTALISKSRIKAEVISMGG
jgi:hypothetical protein